MNVKRVFLTLSLALALSLSCVTAAGAVVRGQASSSLNGQVQIYVASGDTIGNAEDYICVGSLISVKWVLTAKHCIVESHADIDNLGLMIGDKRLGHGTIHYVDSIHLNTDTDTALLELEDEVSNPSLVIPYGLGTPAVGTNVAIRGWGSDPSDVLQVATMSTVDTRWTGAGEGNRLLFREIGQGAATAGDSGAGIYLKGKIYGVESTTTDNDNPAEASAVPTDDIADWIKATTGVAGTNSSPLDLRLLPLGDSITFGAESSTKNGYRGPLRSLLISEGFGADFVGENATGVMYDNYNDGWPGYRIDNVDAFVDRPVTKFRPNVITLMLGTNDMNQSYALATAPDRLSKTINDVLAAAPDATVLVATLVPSTDPVVEANIAAYNQQVPVVVQNLATQGKHVALADMSAVTTADLADRLHPNDGGYQKVADAFNSAVQNAVGAGWISAPADCSTIGAGCSDPAIVAGSAPDGTDPNPPDTGWPAAPPVTPVPISRPGPPAKAPQPALPANGWATPVMIAGGAAAGDTVRYSDMDGDGKADYLIVDPTTGGIWGYLNDGAAAGPTGWSAAHEFAGGAAPGATVRVADINGDRKLDYLVVDPSTGAVQAWLNNGTDVAGAGGWIPEGQVAAGFAPGATVRFADMNGDGYDDYVAVDPTTGGLDVALNNGTDVAGADGWKTLGSIATGKGAGADVQLADINNDGYADYLVVDPATGAVKAWLNGGGASAGGSWTWTALGTIADGGGTNGWPVQFADIDGDGAADYLVVAPSNGATWAWLNKGGTSLIPTLTGTGGWVAAGHVAEGGDPGTVQFADVNGDGKDDYLLVGAANNVTAFYSDGPGREGWKWTAAGQVANGIVGDGLGVHMTDMNGDGYADYVRFDPFTGETRVSLNTQTGTASGQPSWKPDMEVVPASSETTNYYTFASVSGLPSADLITVNPGTGAFAAWFNLGLNASGTWAWGEESILVHGSSTFDSAMTVDFADIDGDGRDDYLAVNPSTGATLAWINHGGDPAGADGWVYRGQIASGQSAAGDRVTFGDINGDGLDDYLVVHLDNSVDAWLNNSAGAH